MRKPKTHFEQIPVAVVKKLTEPDVAKKKATGAENGVGQTPVQKRNL